MRMPVMQGRGDPSSAVRRGTRTGALVKVLVSGPASAVRAATRSNVWAHASVPYACNGSSDVAVGVEVRTPQRRNKDGSTVRYVSLAHNRRDGEKVKAETLISLGREDRLDVDGLRRLVGSISRLPRRHRRH